MTTKKQLQNLAVEAIEQIELKKEVGYSLPVKGLSNSKFDKKRNIVTLGNKTQKRLFFNYSSAKPYLQTFLVLEKCLELLQENKTTSIRDLYYMAKYTIEGLNEQTFDDQTQSDGVVEDIEGTVGMLREQFGLFAASRGAMVGELTVNDSGDLINLRKQGSGGWGIPSVVEPGIIKFKKCDAKFILVVEKDASFRRLNEDKFWKHNQCILLHGQGMPPRGVRRLVHRMHNELKLPVYILTDNDPWGIYIYSVIRSGSMNLAFESERIAVPKAKWLGIRSNDYDTYKLTKNCVIKFDKSDASRLKQIAQYPWLQSTEWKLEFNQMKKNNFKMEIESLASKGLDFLSKYLLEKINKKNWID